MRHSAAERNHSPDTRTATGRPRTHAEQPRSSPPQPPPSPPNACRRRRHDLPLDARRPRPQTPRMPATARRRPTTNPQAQLAQAVSGLLAIQEGKAKSRHHAAEIAGLSHSSLRTTRIAALKQKFPALAGIARTSPLEITAEIKGEGTSKRRVSMREALSAGAERCVAIMAELGPKVGHMTKEEERSYLQAARWLQMCRTIGLFGENEGAALPSELRYEQPERTDTPEHWTKPEQMERITARMITVIPEPEPENL